jgi:hypothetical protein
MDGAGSKDGRASADADDRDYYTYRVRKRDARALGALIVLWFLWKEGAEVFGMFRDLFDAVRWLLT